jgi:hypothetical protein
MRKMVVSSTAQNRRRGSREAPRLSNWSQTALWDHGLVPAHSERLDTCMIPTTHTGQAAFSATYGCRNSPQHTRHPVHATCFSVARTSISSSTSFRECPTGLCHGTRGAPPWLRRRRPARHPDLDAVLKAGTRIEELVTSMITPLARPSQGLPASDGMLPHAERFSAILTRLRLMRLPVRHIPRRGAA